jgi:two-component system osmolarity sensor histidine kinase EnvZ
LKLIPRSLLGRTAVTISLTLVLFMVISLGAAVYFIAIPMAERSADDFAAVIVSAAQTLESSPGELHEELKKHLLENHGLIVTTQRPALAEKSFDVPYYIFFQESLAQHAGQELKIIESESGPIIWVDVPTDKTIVRIGFDRGRLGTNPPVVLILAIGGGALLTLLASFLEVRRVVGPLARMSDAVQEVGRGHTPPVLAENGPKEIASLAKTFNRMSSDIQALSENRTVIVAGISHDLRTPLTRLGLAVEMLSEDSDPELIAGIRRDLAAMKSLIDQFLQFSEDLGDGRPVELDLGQVLEAHAADLRREGIEVELNSCDPCPYLADPVALDRLLVNLMENAAHYGRGSMVNVDLRCDGSGVSIEIGDRGPGIPSDQAEAVFRPFHRLETARGSRTGGSGLGLAIARQLANKHNWSVELLPREGGGTIAKVVLPIVSRLS